LSVPIGHESSGLETARKGKLDIVFANAGAAQYAPIGKITEEWVPKATVSSRTG